MVVQATPEIGGAEIIGSRPLAPGIRQFDISRDLSSPIVFLSPDQGSPRSIVSPENEFYLTDRGAAVFFLGYLSNRDEFAWQNELGNKGSDTELLGSALDARLRFVGHFGKVFRSVLTEIRGEFSLIAALGNYAYAGRDRDGAGSGVYMGKSFNDVQSLSSDPDSMQAFGAEVMSLLQPHELVQVSNDFRKVLPWTFQRPHK